MSLTEHIRQAARADGRSIQQLSRATGIAEWSVRRFVRYGTGLRGDSMDKMAAELGFRLTRDTELTTA